VAASWTIDCTRALGSSGGRNPARSVAGGVCGSGCACFRVRCCVNVRMCNEKKNAAKKGVGLGVCPLLHALPLAPLWCLLQCASSQGHSLFAGKAKMQPPLQPSSPRASFPPRHLVAARARCVGQWHAFGNIPVAFCLHDAINKKMKRQQNSKEKRVSSRSLIWPNKRSTSRCLAFARHTRPWITKPRESVQPTCP
jgi:hypothetical protein